MIVSARPTILVVDDEPAILDALEDLLEDDFQVLKASNVAQGLDLLEEHTVSVVLSDQKMPGMKGEEFLARVAQSHVTTRVLLTGYTDFEDLVRAVNRGHIYAFVSKPWSPHQLRSLVKAAAERFHLEKELLHEKHLLKLLLEHSPDLISIKDDKGRYLRLNSACEQALQANQDAVGQTDEELGGPLFLDAPAREKSILAGGEPDIDRTEKATHGHRWYSTTRVSTLSEVGPPLLIGISREITERLESNRRLEDHAQKLEKMNDELARFSFIAAHHLQEPLRSIAGFTELLQRRDLLKEGANEYLDFISDSVRRAKSLMHDFQTYLDCRKTAAKAPASLRQAAQASIDSLSSQHQAMPVTLHGDASVMGHAELLEQLFRALIDNALVHGGSEQEVVVKISTEGVKSKVTIEDQGPGIPLEAHDRVFRLFETLETDGRSGLGLALCQKIVELHGGEIWLENHASPGLRVVFTLQDEGALQHHE